MVAGASAPLAASLDHEPIAAPRRPLASTVVGSLLDADTDVRGLLLRQVTAPVRFLEAVETVAADIDLWIEVGPGRVLTGLAVGWMAAPAIATEAGGPSLRGLLRAVGAAFALGAPIAPPRCSMADSDAPSPTTIGLASSRIPASGRR